LSRSLDQAKNASDARKYIMPTELQYDSFFGTSSHREERYKILAKKYPTHWTNAINSTT